MFVNAQWEDLDDTGYFKTLDLIAGYASTSLGSQRVRQLRPLANISDIMQEIALVADLRSLMESDDGFHMPPYTDITEHIQAIKAHVPALDPLMLRDLAKNVRASISLRKRALSIAESRPGLALLFNGLQPNSLLASSVEESIDESGEILDRASSKLRSLRRRVGDCRERIGKSLKGFIGKAKADVQEEIVTTRSSRYVVLLKSGARARNQGIVHDESGSGQAVYFEPMEVFELNNELASFRAEEREEVLRILRELTSIAAGSIYSLESDFSILQNLDTVYARAGFARARHCEIPQLGAGRNLRILQGRHPLLGDRALPVDIIMPDDVRFLIISGPNAGGKSVTLKMVALMTMLAQTAIPIPASPDTSLPLFDTLFTDIGDKQSIESNLSTFSSHIVSLDRITRNAAEGTLVLIDEICDGTDPEEAAALAMGVVRKLKSSGAFCIITSHYSPLKVFAMEEPGVVNGAMTFDEETLTPTFRLRVGLPGKSYGIAIARRMGMDKEVIATSLEYLSEDKVRVEDVVTSLEKTRVELDAELDEARRNREALISLRQDLETRMEELRNREEIELMDLLQSTLREIHEEKQCVSALISELRQSVKEGHPKSTGRSFARGNGHHGVHSSSMSVRTSTLPDGSGAGLSGGSGVSDGSVAPAASESSAAVHLSRPNGREGCEWPEGGKGNSGENSGGNSGEGREGREGSGRRALKALSNMEEKLRRRLGTIQSSRPAACFAPGAKVLVTRISKKGLLVERRGDDAWLVELGSLRMTVETTDLRLIDQATQLEPRKSSRAENGIRADAAVRTSFSPVLDLRGEYVEEALMKVERFIADSMFNDMETVRIIHGKGTGRLRRAVTDYLRECSFVSSYALAEYNDGGNGVTIVRMVR
jgi:DNA mismatch repair protein MutS2